jgi:hypothetical protein
MLGSDFLHHQRDGGRNAQYSVVYLCESSTAVSVETAEVDLARSCFLFHLKSLECAFQALGVTRTVSNQHKKHQRARASKGQLWQSQGRQQGCCGCRCPSIIVCFDLFKLATLKVVSRSVVWGLL